MPAGRARRAVAVDDLRDREARQRDDRVGDLEHRRLARARSPRSSTGSTCVSLHSYPGGRADGVGLLLEQVDHGADRELDGLPRRRRPGRPACRRRGARSVPAVRHLPGQVGDVVDHERVDEQLGRRRCRRGSSDTRNVPRQQRCVVGERRVHDRLRRRRRSRAARGRTSRPARRRCRSAGAGSSVEGDDRAVREGERRAGVVDGTDRACRRRECARRPLSTSPVGRVAVHATVNSRSSAG